jgi:protein-S-isoprenylcysteine O-methyltransferase Ste14
MTTETVFRLLTACLLVAVCSISIYFRHQAERHGGQLNKSEGQPLIVGLRLLGLIALLPLLGYLFNPAWVEWARFSVPDWLRWLAALVAGSMVPAIYWLFATIGVNISPSQTTRQGHRLITSGPYRWIRHPLYTFGALFFSAFTLLTGLWWLGAGLALGFVILLWRTRREEAWLITTFGDEYRAYMARTGGYLPRWR